MMFPGRCSLLRRVACACFINFVNLTTVAADIFRPIPLVRADAWTLISQYNVQCLRFRANHVLDLIAVLGIPAVMHCDNGCKFSALEAGGDVYSSLSHGAG